MAKRSPAGRFDWHRKKADVVMWGKPMYQRLKYSFIAIVVTVAALGAAQPDPAQSSPAAGVQLAQSRMPESGADPDAEMRMPVPGGSNLAVRGCWRNKQILYGRYRVSFCLARGVDGSYRVEGGGLTCRGDLDWSRDGRRVEIRFNRGRCNRNIDWSRDRISCRIEDGQAGSSGVPVLEPAQTRMPTQGSGGEASRMNCTYRPSTGPYGPERFTARRTD